MRWILTLLGLLLLGLGIDLFLIAREPMRLKVRVGLDAEAAVQIFFDTGEGFRAVDSAAIFLPGGMQTAEFFLPATTQRLRIDPLNRAGDVHIPEIELRTALAVRRWNAVDGYRGFEAGSGAELLRPPKGDLYVRCTSADPQIELLGFERLRKDLRNEARISLALVLSLGALVLGLAALWPRRGRRDTAPAPETAIRTEETLAPVGKPPQRRAALAPKIAVLLGTTLLMVLLGRWVWQKMQPDPGPGYDDRGGAYALRFVDREGRRISKVNGPLALVFDPFTVYRTQPEQKSPHYAIDAQGFRGEGFALKRPRVFCFGGSATFGYGLEQDSELFTSLLCEQDPTKAYVNAGIVGFATGQELSLMVHHLENHEPVGYVLLSGWNDIAERLDSKMPFACNRTFELLAQRLHAHHLVTEADADPQARTTPAAQLDSPPEVDAILAEAMRNYGRMHAIAKARGARFHLLLQPERLRSLGKLASLEGNERMLVYARAYDQLVPKLIAACAEAGIPCLDVAQHPRFIAARSEELFLDPVHLSAAGHRVLAEIIAAL